MVLPFGTPRTGHDNRRSGLAHRGPRFRCISPDSSRLAIALGDSGASCDVWNVRTQERMHRFTGLHLLFLHSSFPSMAHFCIGILRHTIRLWDMGVTESPHDAPSSPASPYPLSETIIVTGSSDGTIEAWEVGSHNCCDTSHSCLCLLLLQSR